MYHAHPYARIQTWLWSNFTEETCLQCFVFLTEVALNAIQLALSHTNLPIDDYSMKVLWLVQRYLTIQVHNGIDAWLAFERKLITTTNYLYYYYYYYLLLLILINMTLSGRTDPTSCTWFQYSNVTLPRIISSTQT